MKWFKILLRLFRRNTIYDGCTLCYGAGVVRISTGNPHFRGPDITRLCPAGCKITPYGIGKLR